MLAGLPAHWLNDFRAEFETFAHDHQRPPRLANSGKDWTIWLVLGGRGAGKTRAAAEWVRRKALADPHARIALVGEGEHETREVMVEGISGLLGRAPASRATALDPRATAAGMAERCGRATVLGGRSGRPARAAVFGRVV